MVTSVGQPINEAMESKDWAGAYTMALSAGVSLVTLMREYSSVTDFWKWLTATHHPSTMEVNLLIDVLWEAVQHDDEEGDRSRLTMELLENYAEDDEPEVPDPNSFDFLIISPNKGHFSPFVKSNVLAS